MKILGTGSALPSRTATNFDYEQLLDTSDEWISTRTGIKSRQVLTNETLLSLGTLAGQRALEAANVSAEDIDYLICSTLQGDTITPGLGCLLQGTLGAQCGAIDVNGACAGFVYALDMADAYIASGKAKRILIVSAEANTRICDFKDRSTCVLFGDGAGACVVGEGDGYICGHLTSKANTEFLISYPNPGNSPFEENPHPAQSLYMSGQDVYKFAVSAVVKDVKWVCERANIPIEEVDLFVLHQANLRIIDAAQQRLKQPREKFPHNIEVRGNTSSASIPIMLDELIRGGKAHPGQLLVMSAFGAGLTTGACAIRL